MTLEQVKAFLEFEEKPIIELYLETVNLKKEERKQITYLLDGLSVKEIAEIENIEQRTVDSRRKQACEKLALAWRGHAAVLAISEYIISRRASE